MRNISGISYTFHRMVRGTRIQSKTDWVLTNLNT